MPGAFEAAIPLLRQEPSRHIDVVYAAAVTLIYRQVYKEAENRTTSVNMLRTLNMQM
jgi:hypothetical protein